VGDNAANAENMETEEVGSIPVPPNPAENAAEDANLVTVRDDEVDELLAMSGDEDAQDPLADVRVETVDQQPEANQPPRNVVVSSKSSNSDNVRKDLNNGLVDKNVTDKSKSKPTSVSGRDNINRDRNNEDQQKRLENRDDLGARTRIKTSRKQR
jgi:hypothetical protein